MATDPAPYARLRCPLHALAGLSPDELAVLDRYCARALDDPEAAPSSLEGCAAVAWYERALLASGATVYTGRSRAPARRTVKLSERPFAW